MSKEGMDQLLRARKARRGVTQRGEGCARAACVADVALLAIEALLCSMLSSGTPLRLTSISADSFVFRYVALSIQDGGMPYVDAFDHKGPLTYLINLLGLMISSWRGIWVLEFLAILATAVFCFMAARTLTGRLGAHVAVAFSLTLLTTDLWGGNMTEEWALPFISVGIWVLASYLRDGHARSLLVALSGGACGAVVMLRPNMVVIWLVTGVVVALDCVRGSAWSELRRYVAMFLLGLAAVVGPMLVWLWQGGALAAFWDAYFVFNATYTNRASVVSGVAKVGQYLETFLTFLEQPATLASLVVASIRLYVDRRRDGVVWVKAALVSLVSSCLSGLPFEHYALVMVPFVCLCFAWAMGGLRGCTNSLICPAVMGVLAAFLLLSGAPTWVEIARTTALQMHDHASDDSYQPLSGESWEAVDLVSEVAARGDSALVCGASPEILFAGGWHSPSRFFFQNPVCWVEPSYWDEYLADLERSSPVAIVLPRDCFGFAEAADYIDRHGYVLLGTTSGDWATVWWRGQ